ncbi:hypothetical protein [Streptomyces sp. TRM68367]|uniref:hypothetical protein n=1 Tax=Streptomyces sp. TRM68367 TaxID=2758415 RepID=UPI00165C5E3A|nr:hypothetical protein [Streptomyces sp. TRM68367]MBC9728535.1 hypothetical protein [Streptomyces sp. TRM68367]
MANDPAARLRQLWRTTTHGTRTALRWRPFRPDPLASLVRTARHLDYGGSHAYDAERDARTAGR